jgi:hypothetical protein
MNNKPQRTRPRLSGQPARPVALASAAARVCGHGQGGPAERDRREGRRVSMSVGLMALTMAECSPSPTWWVKATDTCSNPAADQLAKVSPRQPGKARMAERRTGPCWPRHPRMITRAALSCPPDNATINHGDRVPTRYSQTGTRSRPSSSRAASTNSWISAVLARVYASPGPGSRLSRRFSSP